MDTVKSFKGYGKVDERDESAFRRKTRKRIIILIVSLVLLLALIIGVVAGVLVHKRNSGDSPAIPSSPAAAVKAVCGLTRYPETCSASLSAANSSDPERIFQFSLTAAMDVLERISTFPEEYARRSDDPLVSEALRVCGEVLDDAVDYLNDTIAAVAGGENLLSAAKIDDLRTWLSAVLTHQETCADALAEANASFAGEIGNLMRNSTELASNSLAIAANILGLLGDLKIPIHRHRRLLEAPAWISAADRRLLETRPKPDVIVASDGSGDVRTVKEAAARIPKKSKTRFVIYVKRGVYKENVLLEKHNWNVMIYGDGKTATTLSGGLNFVDGTPTFSTATFAVTGQGFIAQNMGFINTAGPAKHQAVALRAGSDKSIFYRCSFDAFQDTLYVHSNRQFYRDCDITGTIDFIFGNSAVVFQNCNIMPRQPLPNQFVTITAQGKKDPNQNTAISIQRCVIRPFDNLKAQTYLGRPWKERSTTVIMQSNISHIVDSLGWIAWAKGVDPPSTILYAEYRNTGPGAKTNNRVKWPGYKQTLSTAQAAKYTVQSLIQGPSWLPATSVTYDLT